MTVNGKWHCPEMVQESWFYQNKGIYCHPTAAKLLGGETQNPRRIPSIGRRNYFCFLFLQWREGGSEPRITQSSSLLWMLSWTVSFHKEWRRLASMAKVGLREINTTNQLILLWINKHWVSRPQFQTFFGAGMSSLFFRKADLVENH